MESLGLRKYAKNSDTYNTLLRCIHKEVEQWKKEMKGCQKKTLFINDSLSESIHESIYESMNQ